MLGADTDATWAGVEGLVVLKTTVGVCIPEGRVHHPAATDTASRTTITSWWKYSRVPTDTTATWNRVREVMLERFFGDWSASVQHQGWMIGQAVLEAVPEIAEIEFRLPNQHHIGFDLTRFGMEDRHVVFQPTSEPYGDIRFRIVR